VVHVLQGSVIGAVGEEHDHWIPVREDGFHVLLGEGEDVGYHIYCIEGKCLFTVDFVIINPNVTVPENAEKVGAYVEFLSALLVCVQVKRVSNDDVC